MIDLDLTTGKGIVIVIGVAAILVVAWAAASLLAIALLAVAIVGGLYLIWAVGVRANRRMTGRSRGGGGQ